MTSRFVATEADAGQRLDVALSGWLAEPRSRAAARIERGEVRVSGEVASKSHRVRVDDLVEVAAPPERPSGAAGTSPPPVRWEDPHLLVVAKPPGVVVHPGTGRSAGTMVQALAEAGYELAAAGGPVRPGIVHRLDRDTSGLLAVAKTDAAYRGLVDALRQRRVHRRYLALVDGVPPAPGGRIEVPIGRDPRDRKRFAAVPDGRHAVTHWTVLAQGRAPSNDAPTVTLLACELETGRTHQIRVHLAYAGTPVTGDTTYGGRRDIASALHLERPFLHAVRLRFEHPVVPGEMVDVTEPLPPDLRGALERAGIDLGSSVGAPGTLGPP